MPSVRTVHRGCATTGQRRGPKLLNTACGSKYQYIVAPRSPPRRGRPSSGASRAHDREGVGEGALTLRRASDRTPGGRFLRELAPTSIERRRWLRNAGFSPRIAGSVQVRVSASASGLTFAAVTRMQNLPPSTPLGPQAEGALGLEAGPQQPATRRPCDTNRQQSRQQRPQAPEAAWGR